jgi:hypothetical protein
MNEADTQNMIVDSEMEQVNNIDDPTNRVDHSRTNAPNQIFTI